MTQPFGIIGAARNRIPSSPVGHEMRELLSAIACVCPESGATYISGPITTGERFLDWYLESGYLIETNSARYNSAIIEHVRAHNESQILSAASRSRAQSTAPVIEPTSLQVNNWRQEDFHVFWCEVLSRFCSRVVLVDGWQFSAGSVIEFVHAIRNDIQAFDSSLNIVNEAKGRKMVIEAIAKIEASARELSKLVSFAATLRSAIGVERIGR